MSPPESPPIAHAVHAVTEPDDAAAVELSDEDLEQVVGGLARTYVPDHRQHSSIFGTIGPASHADH